MKHLSLYTFLFVLLSLLHISPVIAEVSFNDFLKAEIETYQREQNPESHLDHDDYCGETYFHQMRKKNTQVLIADLQDFKEALRRFLKCNKDNKTKISQIRSMIKRFSSRSSICKAEKKNRTSYFYTLTNKCKSLEEDLKDALKSYLKEEGLDQRLTDCSLEGSIDHQWLSCAMLMSVKDPTQVDKYTELVERRLQIDREKSNSRLKEALKVHLDKLTQKLEQCKKNKLTDCIDDIHEGLKLVTSLDEQASLPDVKSIEKLHSIIINLSKEYRVYWSELLYKKFEEEVNDIYINSPVNYSSCSMAERSLERKFDVNSLIHAIDILEELSKSKKFNSYPSILKERYRSSKELVKRKLKDKKTSCLDKQFNPEAYREEVSNIYCTKQNKVKSIKTIAEHIESVYKKKRYEHLSKSELERARRIWQEAAKDWFATSSLLCGDTSK